MKLRLKISKPDEEELENLPFRLMWLDKQEKDIAQILYNYFTAVSSRWPDSWNDMTTKGNVLPKTNGFKALMRFLKPVYIDLSKGDFRRVPSTKNFLEYLDLVDLRDDQFNTETFKPGSSGAKTLYDILYSSVFES